jgi:hypothetical protein
VRGETTATAFSPEFPAQQTDSSYRSEQYVSEYLQEGSAVKFHVATANDGLGTSWTTTGQLGANLKNMGRLATKEMTIVSFLQILPDLLLIRITRTSNPTFAIFFLGYHSLGFFP